MALEEGTTRVAEERLCVYVHVCVCADDVAGAVLQAICPLLCARVCLCVYVYVCVNCES